MSRYLAGLLGQRGFTAEILPAPIDVVDNPRIHVGPPERWAYVARATALKGGDRFVRCVAEARVAGTLIGDGPELACWQRLAREIDADVTFTGRISREQVAVVLAEHDLCLLLPRVGDSSGTEGFGLALLEGAAQGVPVVGCRTGGVPEAVGPGLILENPDDAIGSVAAIRQWWNPQRGAEALGWVAQNHGVWRTTLALVSPSSS